MSGQRNSNYAVRNARYFILNKNKYALKVYQDLMLIFCSIHKILEPNNEGKAAHVLPGIRFA